MRNIKTLHRPWNMMPKTAKRLLDDIML